jgi:hypothetical protein
MAVASIHSEFNLDTMKITLLALFAFCTALCTASFGQVGVAVLSNQPQIIESPSHPLHAEPHALATETPIVGGGDYTYAQGERPLSDFDSAYPDPPPLGDVARAYRKEKSARKAALVVEKQGS